MNSLNWRPGGAANEYAVTPAKDIWIVVHDRTKSPTIMLRFVSHYGGAMGSSWWRRVEWWIPLDELLATLPGGEK